VATSRVLADRLLHERTAVHWESLPSTLTAGKDREVFEERDYAEPS
jgi:hypothetical protein